MDNQEQHMDKDFQQAFEDFNLDIQPQVWEEIREELHPRKEKKKRRREKNEVVSAPCVSLNTQRFI